MRFLQSFLRDARGATAVEYGLILGIICLVVIVAFGVLTDSLTAMLGMIANKLTTP
jgi:pilus assembly protein Flp/PilA